METKDIEDTEVLRLQLLGKEIDNIVGKKGEYIKNYRKDYDSIKICVNLGTGVERIMSISGNIGSLVTFCKILFARFREYIVRVNLGVGQVPFRCIFPLHKCEFIQKKKEEILKKVKGGTIVIDEEILLNSTEKLVSVSGSVEEVIGIITQIYTLFQSGDCPSPSEPIQTYRVKKKANGGPLIISGGKAYIVKGNYAIPCAADVKRLGRSPLVGLVGLGNLNPLPPPANNPSPNTETGVDISGIAALVAAQLRMCAKCDTDNKVQEMTVPNELIGCVIGKGGTKIAEIRQITGAMITISKYNDDNDGGSNKQDRTITIKGTVTQINLAEYLINTSMELHKVHLDAAAKSGLTPSSIPIIQLSRYHKAQAALSQLTGWHSLPVVLSSNHGGHNLGPQRPKFQQAKPNANSTNNGYPKEAKRGKYTPC